MVNLGIDFGSTYTVVSRYYENRNTPEAISIDGISPYIPSVVSYNSRKNEYKYGKAAKNLTGNRNIKIYKAFKMLLNEQMTPEHLKERGYDDVNTPESIATFFLEKVLKSALTRIGHADDTIGKLVIGVPEVWGQSFGTFDGRSVIRKICTSFDFVKEVVVVSEPASASAFFAYNYKQQKHENFDGRVLLIDYGGGTLDITLTKVMSQGDKMEVKVEKRDGAGENTDREIGNAGIKYMEKVVENAILSSEDYSDVESIEYDSDFLKAVDELEEALMSDHETVEDTFRELEYTPDALEDEELMEIEYKDSYITINYKQLNDTYKEIIYDVLEEKLKNLTENVNTYENNFKIGIVGGFGNFYLVKKQINDMFGISTGDERMEGIIVNQEDRERAISLGAALLANDLISIRRTADFSIGIYAYEGRNNEIAKHYAIKYRQDLEYDTIYYAKDTNGNDVPYFTLSGSIDKFLVNFSSDEKKAFGVTPRIELAKKLQNIVNGHYMMVVGFSVDTTDTITIHIFDYYLETHKRSESEVQSVRLSTIKAMFDVVALNSGDDTV